MTLHDALTFFEQLKSRSSNKSEIKMYEKIIHILSKLESRELSTEQIHSLESKLEELNLESNPSNKKRFYKKAIYNFETYLRDTFSLTIKGYYTTLGTALGSSFGILFGIVFLSSWERSMGISMGLIFGMLLGLTIGRSLDAKALKEERVL